MVSKVTFGRGGAQVQDAFAATAPGEVEWGPGGLYVTTNVLSGTDPSTGEAPDGQLVRYGY
jgi:hypothetical protein